MTSSYWLSFYNLQISDLCSIEPLLLSHKPVMHRPDPVMTANTTGYIDVDESSMMTDEGDSLHLKSHQQELKRPT